MFENTLFSLQKNKKLTIGYFGGSITEGAGASDPSNTSYRALVTNWFRQQFPDADIKEIQAAISGTGTELGIFRCENDLLTGEPDLIFLEYAVNDYGLPYEKICSQYETILRKIYEKNCFAEVVVLFAITEQIYRDMGQGLEISSRSAHTAVAHHYKLPLIDMGSVLLYATMRDGGDFLQYTADTIHPNDKGYALYAQTICNYVKEQMEQEVIAAPIPMNLENRTFCDHLYMNAHIEDCMELADEEIKGFTLINKTLCDRYPHYIESSTPGDSISFTFVGEKAGFYWIMANDSGSVLVSVDGKEETLLHAWDPWCPGGPRAGYAFFAEDLEYGVHKAVIRIADTKAENSTGTAIRIGAMLIS